MPEKNIYGTLNSDGSIATWPEVDLNGQPYERTNATRGSVDNSRFVIVPVNVVFDDELRASLGASASSVSYSKKSKGSVDDTP